MIWGATILRVDENVVVGRVEGETSGGIRGPYFVDRVKEADRAVINGVVGVAIFIEKVNACGGPIFG